MKPQNKISVPFFYTDPIAEKCIYPIKGIIWIAFLILIAVLGFLNISYYSKQGHIHAGMILFTFLAIFTLGILFLFARDILDEFVFDHIAIEDNRFTYFNSRLLSGKKRFFEMGPNAKIVWSVEKTPNNAIENSLYFVDSKMERHLLIDRVRLNLYKNSWDKFLYNLSKLSGLELIKEENNT